MRHDGLVIVRHDIEGLLYDMTTKRIHAQTQRIAADGVADSEDLLWCSVIKAALYQEITKAIDHQRISLSDDCLDDVEFLLRCSHP